MNKTFSPSPGTLMAVEVQLSHMARGRATVTAGRLADETGIEVDVVRAALRELKREGKLLVEGDRFGTVR